MGNTIDQQEWKKLREGKVCAELEGGRRGGGGSRGNWKRRWEREGKWRTSYVNVKGEEERQVGGSEKRLLGTETVGW